ncbi:TIGR03757 family integrating conjugative element protein [Xenorhabdus bovienii]|uniref:Exported protein with integrating conjugative element domain n=1 Tax=Xenorhabdus bovienii str. Intermedium TaxID=1379677 RepID=A0A077QET7_XENBV|nr:TIGR03757 family integrating conjugative element protein [Xenorhabdus bovienii]MDE9482525.1 TIGR03757 family integrating conjugative element protein [Xenorhabdus bovienii]MDE9486904.1 TIGR03757 family integrating conjugative element protein [Xenorhabdus bovienii]MDE9536676.1 TIGR03757 family integrating conjugative element protein [Xenorhabdus bovienii]MDE9557215.1 TIGR03757 family integrating conjugative element protein [Xenorhabdus bovienii]MDE9589880.1 TIGR03757 family integrating conjug
MKKPCLVFLLGWGVAGYASAGTVVYTDHQHPPVNLASDSHVVWLDRPEQLQQQYFAQLSADPRQAMEQAQTMLQSPQWHEQERQIVNEWQNVIRGRALGVQKYPAVVFDDRDVVYGTADVAKASVLREQHQP